MDEVFVRERRIALLVMVTIAGCASSPLTPQQQAQCGPQPTQNEIAEAVQTYIKNQNWKDPDSVHVQNVRIQDCRSMYNGFLNGGGHSIGWEIDFEVNAKNSYGGYSGFQSKSLIRTADGQIHWQLE